LGLALVAAVAELHGGGIIIAGAEKPNEAGLKMTLTLPLNP
jgi:signal transduction histidine kinase